MALWLVVAGAAYDAGYRTACFAAASLTTRAASTESTTFASSTDSTSARSTTFAWTWICCWWVYIYFCFLRIYCFFDWSIYLWIFTCAWNWICPCFSRLWCLCLSHWYLNGVIWIWIRTKGWLSKWKECRLGDFRFSLHYNNSPRWDGEDASFATGASGSVSSPGGYENGIDAGEG